MVGGFHTNRYEADIILAAVDITLTEEEIKYLEEPYKPMQVIEFAVRVPR